MKFLFILMLLSLTSYADDDLKKKMDRDFRWVHKKPLAVLCNDGCYYNFYMRFYVEYWKDEKFHSAGNSKYYDRFHVEWMRCQRRCLELE